MKVASNMNTKGKTRRFRGLLEGRFRLTKVVRIDHKDDGNEVNDKVFDYSYKTIEELMEVGYQDASMQIDMQRMKDGVMKLTKINQHIISENGEQYAHIENMQGLYKTKKDILALYLVQELPVCQVSGEKQTTKVQYSQVMGV